ncbi:MAG: transglutaminase-like domain-containing protein [Candidatus Aenigmarchaeota archaeon]|nr:transglutaminase-like domain-containing protein [Candidatus Aenigmarchaeota archaeon]
MKGLKPIAFFALIAIISVSLFQSALAAGIEDNVLKNPANVNELVVNITQSGTIITDGQPTKITVSMNIPQDDDRQDVSMDVTRIRDELGTDLGIIEQASPGNRFSYSIEGVVKSRASHLTSLPASYSIPNDVKAYMQPTKNIQSGDASIKSLALEITKDSKDDFERVAKLAMWVHDHLDYDLSYSGRNLDALSVLAGRRGVCSEYTTLFIAFARSMGIPAKFVSGYSYGERGWERHAYSEVYLGKWVPVDALWLEIGYMDATHIKFGSHLDSVVKNNVEITGYNVNSINWADDDVVLSTITYSPVAREDAYNLTISGQNFRRGDEGVVSLTLVPTEFIVGSIVLEPCAGDYSVVDVIDKQQNVILRPGVREQVYWKIKISEDLPNNLLFTCPLTLNSRSLALRTTDAFVNTQYPSRGTRSLSAHVASSMVELGDEQKVYITVKDLAKDAKVGVIAGDAQEEWSIDGDFQTFFTFKPKELGEKEVVVYLSEGELVSLKYTVTSQMQVTLDDVTVPAYLKVGEKKNVSAFIVNHGSSEESVHMNINIDGTDNFASFMLKTKYFVSLPVSFSEKGAKTILFEASVAGMNISEAHVIEVYEEPVIVYDTDYSDGKAILKLDVRNSKAKNISITIAGQEKKLVEAFGKTSVEFALAPGQYQMEINCYDVAGNRYVTPATIEFREKNFFEQLLALLNEMIAPLFSLFNKAVQ